MRKLRGLLVDDTPSNNEVIEQTLTLEFATLGLEVHWEPVGNAIQARQLVRDSDVFDFAIIDLYLQPDQHDGTAVVRELRDKDRRSFILVVTSQTGRDAGFVHRAKEAGATHAIGRAELIKSAHPWEYSRVACAIRDHLIETGLVTTGTFNYDDRDSGVVALLDALGADEGLDGARRIVRNLATRCIGVSPNNECQLTLSYLAPGRSGAHVCRIDHSQRGVPTESFVVKFSLDHRALRREREANREAVRVLSQRTLVAIHGEVQTDPSGYAAIAAKVAERTVPLSTWLTCGVDEVAARQVARILFGEELSELFRDELRSTVPFDRWLSSSALLQLRIEHAMSRLDGVLRREEVGCPEPDLDWTWRTLKAFVHDTLLPGTPAGLPRGEAVFVAGFGDLHSGNVLVDSGHQPRPVLIDASMFSTAKHWGGDAARLTVDLWLRVRDGGAPAMLWSDLPRSVEEAQALCPHCQPLEPRDLANDPTRAFLDETVRNLSAFLQLERLLVLHEESHWQWHVALAKELLRQGCHADLTPMRNAAALLAAARHLQTAGDLASSRRF